MGKQVKKTDDELHGVKTAYREFFDGIPVPYLSVGVDGIIEWANAASGEFLGYLPNELCGMEVLDIYTDETKAKAKILLAKLKTGEGWLGEEMVYRRKDSKKVYGLLSVNPVKDESDRVIASRSIIVDINDRKLTEEALKKSESELEVIFVNSPLMMMLLDEETNILRVNTAAETVTGSASGELTGKRGGEAMRCIYHLDVPGGCGFGPACGECTIRNTVINTLKTGEPNYRREADLRVMDDKGGEGKLDLLVSSAIVEDRNQRRILVTFEDITARKRAEKTLLDQQNQLETIFAATVDCMILLDRDFVYRAVNPVFCRFVGKEADELVGKTDFDVFPSGIAEEYRQSDINVFETGDLQTEEKIAVNADGEERWLQVVKTPIFDSDSGVSGLLVTARDITDRVKMEARIRKSESKFRRLSIEDPLTGVYNRRYFFERGVKVFNRARKEGTDLSVALLDIDHFKKINDTFGHVTGDYILRKLAELISENIRPNDLLCRYGGEEFVVLFQGCKLDEATEILVRIKSIVEKQVFVFEDIEIRTTISAGVAYTGELDKTNHNLDELIKIADNRMYFGKQFGRNMIVNTDDPKMPQ